MSSFVIQIPSLAKDFLLQDDSRLSETQRETLQARKAKRNVLARLSRKLPTQDPPSLVETLKTAVPLEGRYESLYQLLQYVKATLEIVYLSAQLQFMPTETADNAMTCKGITIRHTHAGRKSFVSIQFHNEDTDVADGAEAPFTIAAVDGHEAYTPVKPPPPPRRTSPRKLMQDEDSDEEDTKPSAGKRKRAELEKEWEQKWNSMWEKVQAFREEKGHANVPKDYIPDRSLGSWVSSQRTAYKEGRLKQERIEALNDLGFVWSFRTIGKPEDMKDQTDVDWDEPAVQRKWKAMLERLKQYKESKGDTRVPSGYKVDPPLAYWVQNQRVLYKKGKLPQERIDALEEIGFLWRIYPLEGVGSPRRPSKAEQDIKWYELLERLKGFKAEFGHTVVQHRYEKDLELGKWVQIQRRIEKEGKMKPERKAELDALEFTWKANSMGDRSWQDSFERLLQFKAKWGDCLVPTKYEPDQKLASWVMWQRGKYHQNKLPEEHIAKLNAEGFVWKVQRKGRRINHTTDVRGGYKNQSNFIIWSPSTSNEFWEAQLEKLRTYKAKYGHTNVPVVYFEDLQLAKWVTAQRMMHTKGQLSQERVDKLEALGFVWRLVRTWEDNYERLKEYQAKNGNCDVPVDYTEDPKLGRWVKSQRAYSKRKELSVERLNSLAIIGFSWNTPKGTKPAWSSAPATPTASPKPAPPKNTPASGVEMPTDKAARLRATNARLSEDRRNLDAENRELRRKLREAVEGNTWDDNFEQLKDYVAEHGDAHVPTGGSKLGQWVGKMRDQYKRSVLKQERVDKLEAVGFEWSRKRGRPAAEESAPVDEATEPAEGPPSPKTTKRTTVEYAEIMEEEQKLQREKDKLAEAKRKLEEDKQKLRLRREALEAAKKRKASRPEDFTTVDV